MFCGYLLKRSVAKYVDRVTKSRKAKDAAETDDVESSHTDSTDSDLTDNIYSSDDTIVPATKRKMRMRINGKKRFNSGRDCSPQFFLKV